MLALIEMPYWMFPWVWEEKWFNHQTQQKQYVANFTYLFGNAFCFETEIVVLPVALIWKINLIEQKCALSMNCLLDAWVSLLLLEKAHEITKILHNKNYVRRKISMILLNIWILMFCMM